jgi:hypothetical protein
MSPPPSPGEAAEKPAAEAAQAFSMPSPETEAVGPAPDEAEAIFLVL